MKPREIYLVNFPFSDLSSSKLRPALVISGEEYNANAKMALLMALTSNLSLAYSVVISDKDLDKGTVFGDKCAVQYDNIFRADRSIIQKRIMVLKQETFNQILKKLKGEIIQ